MLHNNKILILLSLICLPFSLVGQESIQSINAITFSPDGTLFIGDSKSAHVFALKPETALQNISYDPSMRVGKIDALIADVVGTSVEDLSIQDMAVNPVSGKIYLALHGMNNQPMLLTIDQKGNIEPFDLKRAKLASKSIENPVASDAKDSRGRELRHWAISDIQFADGKVLLTGLSNKEFGSTFRSLAYPFTDGQQDASLEIYHAAHGQFETHAPVKTFTTASIGGKTHIIASYTCTPLVLFPMDDLKEGKHIVGRTVAELGAGNTPLDMIILEKAGNKILLMSNSNRPVMKIMLDDLSGFSESLTEPVDQPAETAGVHHVSFPMTNVIQMDKWGDSNWLMLKRQSNGDLDLLTGNDFWL